MAATVTIDERTVLGNQRARFLSITLDTSYPTGGYALSTDQLDLPAGVVLFLQVNIPGYLAVWDGGNKKVKLYRQTAATSALIEVANAVDVSGATGGKIFVIGH